MQAAQPDGSLSIIGKSEDRQKHTHDKELLVPATERTGGEDSSSVKSKLASCLENLEF